MIRAVSEDAEEGEDVRQALHLVQHDEPFELREREPGVGETRQRRGVLEIEPMDRPRFTLHDPPRERCLADLAGAEDADDGMNAELSLHEGSHARPADRLHT